MCSRTTIRTGHRSGRPAQTWGWFSPPMPAVSARSHTACIRAAVISGSSRAAGSPPGAVAALAMAGGNAVDVFGLDRLALASIARQIGALTAHDLTQPIDVIPDVHPHCRAFRGINSAGARAGLTKVATAS